MIVSLIFISGMGSRLGNVGDGYLHRIKYSRLSS
jgi:hypothetical protein